ncbi:hypothetical protein [Xanthomonas sp. XNM01]|uniref:hypothetical protein n=1 Tax=Xanthomonas sp. XNM01 TaxID=2769289 RepID=UPI00178547A9|nr:hypothetical protein [Xanthomonas sp. XNM01]MBD9368838.1 hypothetical protein [Xanthomonas sp. XNM01]
MSESRSVSPSNRQVALELTCAILSNPTIVSDLHVDAAADEAIRLLNLLEKRLRVGPTATRPAG